MTEAGDMADTNLLAGSNGLIAIDKAGNRVLFVDPDGYETVDVARRPRLTTIFGNSGSTEETGGGSAGLVVFRMGVRTCPKCTASMSSKKTSELYCSLVFFERVQVEEWANSSPIFSGRNGTYYLTALLQCGRMFRFASPLAQPAHQSDGST